MTESVNLNLDLVQQLSDAQLIQLQEGIVDELKVRLTIGRKKQEVEAKLPFVVKADPKAPQVTRRQIVIAQAKRELHEHKNFRGHYTVGFNATTAEFHVNLEKGAVTCLLKGINSKKVIAKGVAKCDPQDVFNVHIGRIIALRRALGLNITEFYTEVPNPEKAEVGDYVQYDGRVLKVVNDKDKWIYGKTAHINSLAVRNGKVVNDSKE